MKPSTSGFVTLKKNPSLVLAKKATSTNDDYRKKTCNICNKSISKHQYPIHVRAHLGIKPFICIWTDVAKGECLYSSADRRTVFRHIQKHHTTDDVTNYIRVDEAALAQAIE